MLHRTSLVLIAGALLLAGTSRAASSPSFSAPRQFLAGAFDAYLDVADFDADGRADFVVNDQAGPFPCTVFRPNPSAPGTSYANQTYAKDTFDLAAGADDMAAGLLDGDAYADLVFASQGSVYVVTNAGPDVSGHLQFTVHAPLDAGPTASINRVRIVDWNHDGKMDIVGVGFGLSQGIVAVFLNGAGGVTGAFSPAVVTTLAHFNAGGGIAVADVTHDGFPDVAITYPLDGAVGVLANAADGSGNAVDETDVAVGFTARSVTFGELTDAQTHLPELIVSGTGTSADGNDTDVKLAVAQNLSADGSTAPAFQASTSFAFPGRAANPSWYIPTDVAAADLDGDGIAEVAFVNHANDLVTVVKFAPTLSGSTVTSWGSPTTADFACGHAPARVAFLDADGDGATDIVVSSDDNAGVDVLVSGASSGPQLAPAQNLTLTVGGKKAKASFANGSAAVFTCTDPNTAVAGRIVQIQSTTDPTDPKSWRDLPGGGVMAAVGTTGKETLSQQTFPIGRLWFRANTSASGYADAPETFAPNSKNAARYIGPYDVQPSPPRFALFVQLTDPTQATVPVLRGEEVLEQLVYQNSGDTDAKNVYVAGRVPTGCTVSDPGGGSTAIGGAVLFGPMTVAAHSVGTKSFTATVDRSVAVGTQLQATSCAIGALKVSKGKIQSVKGAVVADSNVLPVEGDLSVGFRSDVTSAAVGDSFSVWFDVANRTSGAIDGGQFVLHLPPFAQFSGGSFYDANGNFLPGFSATTNAARDTVTWNMSFGAFGAIELKLDVRVRFDQASIGALDFSNYSMTGTDHATGAPVAGDPPVAASVPVSGSSPAGVAKIVLREGVDTGNDFTVKAPWGQIDYASPDAVDFDDPDAPGQPGRLQYAVFYRNVGDGDALLCTLHATVPAGTDLVPGSFRADGVPLAADPVSGSAISYDIGTMPSLSRDGVLHVLSFVAKIRAPGTPGAAALGDVITTQFASITSDSYAYPVYIDPLQLRVLVATPAQFDVRKTVTHSGLALNQSMTITYSITNVGTFDSVGTAATFGWPKYEQHVSSVLDGVAVAPTASGKTSCTCPLGDFAGGQTKTLSMTVQLTTKPPATTTLVNTLDLHGTAKSGTKSGAPSDPTAHDDEATNFCDPSKACVFVAAAATSLAGVKDDIGYVFIVGNTTDKTATGVKLTTRIPNGTTLQTFPAATAGLSVSGGIGTWSVGSVPPHSVKSYYLAVRDDGSLSPGDAIVQEAAVTASNAETKVSGGLTTTLYAGTDTSGAVAASRAFYVNAITYKGGNAGVDAALDALDDDTVGVQIRGADFVVLQNGICVVTLGNDQVLAFGSSFKLTFDGHGAQIEPPVADQQIRGLRHDSFYFVSGATSSVSLIQPISDACGTITTLHDALEGLPGHLQCRTASLVATGGGNLVNAAGDHLVPYRVGALAPAIGLHDAVGIVAQGGGNIVAQGGGNIVAAGAGNIVSHDGGSLTAAGSASAAFVLPSMIVAAGGGNLISPNGSNLISPNGSNIVSQGGGNIVSQGGGNIVSQGGGNIVSQGGGNIVAQGGLN